MNYELAKKLKDAGFPQGKSHLSWCRAKHFEDASIFEHCLSAEDDSDYVKIPDTVSFIKLCDSPTLSELISACPEDGTQLIRGIGKKYFAEFIDHSVMPFRRTHLVEAFTPEEAVAQLWLKLNER